MAFLKTANAKIQRHSLDVNGWNGIRKGGINKTSPAYISNYSPEKYLLTHCSIIASVDVEKEGPTNKKGWQYYITPETEKYINSNEDSWERNLLLATYHTFRGAENYLEHVQIPELSKGKIIDAVARDLGDTIYVDILVATDRKHTELVQDIETGKISTLSMGCSVTSTTCTKCGNVAHDDTDMCLCIKYAKGNTYIDPRGKVRRIAELCGHSSDPESVKFIEASWVGNPAFKGAVMRNILKAEDITESKIKEAFEVKKYVDPDAMRKAASELNKSIKAFLTQGAFNFEDEEPSEDPVVKKPESEPSPITQLTDEMKELIRNKVKKELRDELTESDPKYNLSLKENNENMVRSTFAFSNFKQRYASYGSDLVLYRIYEGLVSVKTAGWKSLSTKDFTGREILALSHFIDMQRGNEKLDKKIYSAIDRVGGTKPYNDPIAYLNAIGKTAGIKKMSSGLAKQLIYKGNLYSYGI